MPSINPADLSPARVVSVFGPRVLLETADGQRFQCLLASRKLKPVCGDRVLHRPPTSATEGVVASIEPRNSVLRRPDMRGRVEIVAANITQLVIMSAVTPPADPFLIDRYLVAAELMPAKSVCVYNKIDLLTSDPGSAKINLNDYGSIGYDIAYTSTRSGAGVDRLRELLRSDVSILVGQSGVGKSSLLNILLPGADAVTRSLSDATGRGRHTTTASILHHLSEGGELIDTPGVRDFAPPPVADREVAHGFIEFRDLVSECRFNDCMHLDEPDCAVTAAVTDGRIVARRYESYKRLVRQMRELAEKQKP